MKWNWICIVLKYGFLNYHIRVFLKAFFWRKVFARHTWSPVWLESCGFALSPSHWCSNSTAWRERLWPHLVWDSSLKQNVPSASCAKRSCSSLQLCSGKHHITCLIFNIWCSYFWHILWFYFVSWFLDRLSIKWNQITKTISCDQGNEVEKVLAEHIRMHTIMHTLAL